MFAIGGGNFKFIALQNAGVVIHRQSVRPRMSKKRSQCEHAFARCKAKSFSIKAANTLAFFLSMETFYLQ